MLKILSMYSKMATIISSSSCGAGLRERGREGGGEGGEGGRQRGSDGGREGAREGRGREGGRGGGQRVRARGKEEELSQCLTCPPGGSRDG